MTEKLRNQGFWGDWLGILDSRMILTLGKIAFDFPMVFLPRATVDAIFAPRLWVDVNMTGERQLFPRLTHHVLP